MKLFFRKLGNSPKRIVILHGLYGSSDNWMTIARQLEDSFTIYLLDLRNHGQSPHSEVHNYEAMAEDVVEFLDAEQIDRCLLLGHSMGGKVGMHIALFYPNRLEKLIVVDIGPVNYPQHTLDHIAILDPLVHLDLAQIHTRSDAAHALQDRFENPNIIQFILKNLYRKKGKGFAWKMNVPVLRKAVASITENTEDWGNRKSEIPTLFVKAELSDYLLESHLPIIENFFPSARFTIVAGVGHWIHSERPQKVLATIQGFF